MLNKIYSYSPVFIQNILVSIYGFYWKNRRLGGCFKEKLKSFKDRESYTKNQWVDYQTLELRKLLIHGFTTVPFYADLYSKHGFTLNDLKKFEMEDLAKLPFLEKDDLRQFGTTTLLSSKKEKGNFYFSSGSSGTPTSIYFSKKTHQSWSAIYEARVRNWAGLNYKIPRAMVGGRRVLPTSISRKPFYRYNYAESQAYFSAYHISEKNTKDYVDGLFKSKSEYFVGYAMSIYLLSEFILKLQLKTPELKAVLTSSEKLTSKMRSIIEEAFKCKVYDAYSGMEACGLISENSKGDLLFSPDSGIMEVIDDEGTQVGFGESGELIATGFLNYDQPLIRYRIGDRVKLSKNQVNKLGTEMLKIEEIEGRCEDIIIGYRGQKMVRFHSVFIGISSIIMAQVIQQTLNCIEIKLVVDSSYLSTSEDLIKKRIKNQLGEDIIIKFSYVSSVKRSDSGKFKAVISNLENG